MRMIAYAGLIWSLVFLGSATSAPPPPKLAPMPDPNSPEWQDTMGKRAAAARLEAEKTGPVVTMRFAVVWLLEYGYQLYDTPGADPSDLSYIVTPHFQGDARQTFDAFFTTARPSDLIGRRVLCECTGVEWKDLGRREFIVHKAALHVQ